MEFKELRKALAAEAKKAGICKEWYNFILNASSMERLLVMYYKGFDFIQDNNFPSVKLRKEFDGVRQHFNIYENEPFSAKNPRQLVAYAGASGSAVFTGYAVSQIWAMKDSEISINAGGGSYITLDVAPGARVRIKADGNSRVIVFNHGGAVTHEAAEKAIITIKDK